MVPLELWALGLMSAAELRGGGGGSASWTGKDKCLVIALICGILNKDAESSCCGSAGYNLTSTHEHTGSIPSSLSGLRIWPSCGVGCRRSLDPVLLWLWRRLEDAALIRPLARELPYAAGAALKRQKKEKESHVFF